MINQEYKLIYIHIPKCAGTSVEEALGHYRLYNGRGKQDHRTILEHLSFSPFCADRRMNFYRSYFNRMIGRTKNPKNWETVSEKEFYEFFKFTIVRHPLERFQSMVQNIIRDPVTSKRYGYAGGDINEFALTLLGKMDFKPQLYWLTDSQDTILVDRIFRFEDMTELHSFLKEMCPGYVGLPHRLKSDAKIDLSNEIRNTVVDYYQLDFEILGY